MKIVWPAAAVPLALVAVQVAGVRSVWDGVYTDAQARRGADIYAERCVRCHGPDYVGGTEGAGPLVGPVFTAKWDDVPLDQMLDRVRLTMPQDRPASLSRQQTADVLAFVFSVNKIPAGSTELPSQAPALAQIHFKATK